MTWSERLGTVGVWRGVNDTDPALAKTIEDLGYGTIWQGRSPASHLREAEELLDATKSIQIATGIVNIWKSDPAGLADSYHRIEARHSGRLLLGIGSGHREDSPERCGLSRPWPAISMSSTSTACLSRPACSQRWGHACSPWRPSAVPAPTGTSPSPPRPVKPGPSSAPRRSSPPSRPSSSTDPEAARRVARAFLDVYLGRSNYTTNMQRAGFTTEDVAHPGSDHLVDEIVVHGDAAALAAAVRAHLDAGADHVCVQVQPASSDIVPALGAIAAELKLHSTP